MPYFLLGLGINTLETVSIARRCVPLLHLQGSLLKNRVYFWFSVPFKKSRVMTQGNVFFLKIIIKVASHNF